MLLSVFQIGRAERCEYGCLSSQSSQSSQSCPSSAPVSRWFLTTGGPGNAECEEPGATARHEGSTCTGALRDTELDDRNVRETRKSCPVGVRLKPTV